MLSKSEKKPGYVPLVIIGNTYHVLGWDDSLGETIIKEALKAYEDDNYTDIVAKEINDNKLEVTEKSFTEACDLVNIKHGVSAKDKIDTKFVICFIIGVVILGFGGLVILSRKKNKIAIFKNAIFFKFYKYLLTK